MTDLWRGWDDLCDRTGRPSRVAKELTDAELLNLLASADPARDIERNILKDEANRRLHGHGPRH